MSNTLRGRQIAGNLVYHDKANYRSLIDAFGPDVVKHIISSTSKLIEDSLLRKKMGEAGRKEVESGRFSIKMRNSQLKRIYEEAVK